MQFKKILLAAAAVVTLTSGAAMAAPANNQTHPVQVADGRWDRDTDGRDRGDRDGRWDRNDDRGGWDRDNDRRDDRGGWADRDHRRHVSNDRIFRELRGRGYRHASAPYFYRGQFVVRAYDYRGRPVLIRVNPYTGSTIGISFRF